MKAKIPTLRGEFPEPTQVSEHDFLRLRDQVEASGQMHSRSLAAWRRWQESWLLYHGQIACLTAAQVGQGKSLLGVVPQWTCRINEGTIVLAWKDWEIHLESRMLPSLQSPPTWVAGWILYCWTCDVDEEVGVVGRRLIEQAPCGELREAIARAIGGYVTRELLGTRIESY